jgi:hypothetical protein
LEEPVKTLLIAAVALVLAGCTSGSSDRMSFGPSSSWEQPDVYVGAAHRDDMMNPSDPADQQRNQSRGLGDEQW